MSSSKAIVRIESGSIRGRRTFDGAVRAFRGIPYALPPVGQMRWRAPQPVAPWSGVRDADSFGPRCVQPERPADSPFWSPAEPESEDCLYLNVWTSAVSDAQRHPVIVWFHGGAFRHGSASLPIFDGAGLARRQVVLVTVNYRLGRLGFLAHPDLARESADGMSGNYGLRDQIAALHWVRTNIAAFGGDPHCVTIAGQSAGSSSVCYLMASPAASGLFHRCIGQSGAGFGPVKASCGIGGALQAHDDAAASGAAFARSLGAASINDLRARSPHDVQLAPYEPGSFDTGYPIADGCVIPKTVAETFQRRTQSDVPLITGSNAHERIPFSATRDAHIAHAHLEFGDLAERFLQVYPAANDAQAREASATAVGDRIFTAQNWVWARMQARNATAKVYYYRFTHAPPIPPGMVGGDAPGNEPRAFHAAEIPYIFRTLRARGVSLHPSDQALSEIISGYWVRFAATGDPNGGGSPRWPVFDPDTASTLLLSEHTRCADVPHPDRLAFWDAHYSSLQPSLRRS